MRFHLSLPLLNLLPSFPFGLSHTSPSQLQLQLQHQHPTLNPTARSIPVSLYADLEQLARIVDISYCVGTTGIWKPFRCASRCRDFPDFELVATWNTGPLLSDSCGYIALSHSHEHFPLSSSSSQKHIIVAFRGTYSLASAIADLSTIPQPYTPYPAHNSSLLQTQTRREGGETCSGCKVHSGFYASYLHTLPSIIPHIAHLKRSYPDYELTLVGHSLGGAVAALMGLDFEARGWEPRITTFGEPRIGNEELVRFIDERFGLDGAEKDTVGREGRNGREMDMEIAMKGKSRYRRVTHKGDPVPLLPLKQWGYRMHAGEIYISKSELPPSVADVEYCIGDEDPSCIAGGNTATSSSHADAKILQDTMGADGVTGDPVEEAETEHWTGIPSRYGMWRLFFAHRDYFWRLGLCVPGGGPWDWDRNHDNSPSEMHDNL